MKREISHLSDKNYDLLVIGGGIYGACVAWEASLRGLSVALVEKNDFGSATSANSLKIIHGGLRYLQNADFRRMRQSIFERKTLLKIAPHLVHPLPVLLPTFAYGLKSRELLRLALKINDLVSWDRNQDLPDSQKHIPSGRVLSHKEILQLIPGFSATNLMGGVLFHDAQVYNSERLTLAFIKSAAERGAKVANYAEVIGLLQSQGRVYGAKIKDSLTTDIFDLQAKAIINTSGPWLTEVLRSLQGKDSSLKVPLAKAINLVTRRLFDHSYAVGLPSQSEYGKSGKDNRLFFIAPWRGKSLVGTVYSAYQNNPDALTVQEEEITSFIHNINQAYPSAKLCTDDVSFVHRGLLPCSTIKSQAETLQLAQHYQLYNHQQDGFAGLLSVVGVKYTTARGIAQKAVDWVFQMRGEQRTQSISSIIPLYGGQIDQFDAFLMEAQRTHASFLSATSVQRLVYNYGSVYPKVLEYFDGEQRSRNDLAVLKAETKYAINEEMAQKLSDVVFRRTELGSAGMPNYETLQLCAEVMGQELGWDWKKIRDELQEVSHSFNINFPPYQSSTVIR